MLHACKDTQGAHQALVGREGVGRDEGQVEQAGLVELGKVLLVLVPQAAHVVHHRAHAGVHLRRGHARSTMLVILVRHYFPGSLHHIVKLLPRHTCLHRPACSKNTTLSCCAVGACMA